MKTFLNEIKVRYSSYSKKFFQSNNCSKIKVNSATSLEQ